MATRPAPDLVTLASLHAALDGIIEIEALLSRAEVTGLARARLVAIVAEARTLLISMLRPDRSRSS